MSNGSGSYVHENASLARFIAGDFGFFTLIQSRDGPARYRLSRRFETRPSNIMVASRPEEVGADLALLKGRKVDAVCAASQQAG
jgi:hypothetical protein